MPSTPAAASHGTYLPRAMLPWLRAMCSAGLLAMGACLAEGAESNAARNGGTDEAQNATRVDDVEASLEYQVELRKSFQSSLLGKAFEQKQYSGAIITVVQDGAIVMNKGYGYADYASKTVNGRCRKRQTRF